MTHICTYKAIIVIIGATTFSTRTCSITTFSIVTLSRTIKKILHQA
jgi:hypothetical protein